MIPDSLDSWEIEVIEDIVSQGVFESDQFDFKEKLPNPSDSEAKLRLRKTIAAFANSGGGYLVFGVTDNTNTSGTNRLVGIDSSYDFPEHFGNYPSSCEPSIEWRFKNPPVKLSNGNLIHIIQIITTWRRPHIVENKNGNFIFPKRTNKGNEEMSYAEIRSAFHELEFKRSKLSLLISELDFMRTSAKRLLDNVPNPPPNISGTLHWAWATRYNTTLLDQTLGDTFSFFSDDIDLWNTLCLIRDSAKHSNVACEAFSGIVYWSMTNRANINNDHYSSVRESAKHVVNNVDKAISLLKNIAS